MGCHETSVTNYLSTLLDNREERRCHTVAEVWNYSSTNYVIFYSNWSNVTNTLYEYIHTFLRTSPAYEQRPSTCDKRNLSTHRDTALERSFNVVLYLVNDVALVDTTEVLNLFFSCQQYFYREWYRMFPLSPHRTRQLYRMECLHPPRLSVTIWCSGKRKRNALSTVTDHDTDVPYISEYV